MLAIFWFVEHFYLNEMWLFVNEVVLIIIKNMIQNMVVLILDKKLYDNMIIENDCIMVLIFTIFGILIIIEKIKIEIYEN